MRPEPKQNRVRKTVRAQPRKARRLLAPGSISKTTRCSTWCRGRPCAISGTLGATHIVRLAEMTSLLCGWAWDIESMIAFRALQASSAAR